MSTNIEDRVILLLKDRAGSQEGDLKEQGVADRILGFFERKEPIGGHGFWERLGDYTGIASKRWRKVHAREQRVTSDMLEALAHLFPHHAFWLATGITDAVNGHVAPITAQTFPERLTQEWNEANDYFKLSLELNRKLYEEGNVNLEDDKERLYASERTRPLAHWHDSELATAAYRMSNSAEYERLKKQWEAREEDRKKRVEYITSPDERPWVKRRIEAQEAGVKATPILGVDPRSQHQDFWDIFYTPTKYEPQKFALTILNTPPEMLAVSDIEKIGRMDLFVIEDYLKHHGISIDEVIPGTPGGIRNTKDGLTEAEINNLKQIATERRRTSR